MDTENKQINQQATNQLPDKQFVRRSNPQLTSIVNLFIWIIVALTLALIGRAFIMEAFRIPTGSMAETLRGDHWVVRCPNCGYKYDIGFDNTTRPKCPNCNYIVSSGTPLQMSNGDRIFVLKCIYQFFEPKRWDVFVFKNPINPLESYIKRVVGLPGETIEIIDGDIYIDGLIARKPPRVQDELWMLVYDNDYQGIMDVPRAQIPQTANKVVKQPFVNSPGSSWNISAEGSTEFQLDGFPGKQETIYFDTESSGKNFRATYAYNGPAGHEYRPICSDLMVRFHINSKVPGSTIGAEITKYGTTYRGWVDEKGYMRIEKKVNDEWASGYSGSEYIEFVRSAQPKVFTAGYLPFEFACVDHMLILKYGGKEISYDLGREADAAGIINPIPPALDIFGSGSLSLKQIGLYRDIHYISGDVERAGPGEPYTLNEDQFFACGDNSNQSYDSRMWYALGIGNNGKSYRMGTVPRDYLVGKAFFVYWANAFSPTIDSPSFIVNVGQLGPIVGGSKKNSNSNTTKEILTGNYKHN